MTFYTNNLKQKKKATMWKGISIVLGILFLMSLYSAGSVVRERNICVSSLDQANVQITQFEKLESTWEKDNAKLIEYEQDEKCSSVTCMLDEVEYYWYEDGTCYCYGYNDELVKVVEY